MYVTHEEGEGLERVESFTINHAKVDTTRTAADARAPSLVAIRMNLCTKETKPSLPVSCQKYKNENRGAEGRQHEHRRGSRNPLRGGGHARQQRQRAHGRERVVRAGPHHDHGLRSHGNPDGSLGRAQHGVRQRRLRQASLACLLWLGVLLPQKKRFLCFCFIKVQGEEADRDVLYFV